MAERLDNQDAALAGDALDHLTILRSRAGPLTKRLAHGSDRWRVTPFSAGTWFSAHQRPARSFDDLAAQLERVALDPHAAVIRGRLLPGVDPCHCRRLSDRTEHGDAVTFEACAHRWLALDVDGVPEPPCTVFAAEPEAGVEHVLGLLPGPFADASCWWQATGRAGIKPGIRVRLWFWLSRPVADGEAKGWLRGCPVDRSLYTPVALHYVAAPLLAPGTPDPVARRRGVRRGLEDVVRVPAELPAVETTDAAPVALDGEELTEADLADLAAAVLRSTTARAIWGGERTYPDRSTGHFAFAAALARGGCTDPDTLHRALVACDRRHGRDMTKILRPDYARRTIAAALAAEARR
jgi:hypothetical protein